jgi:hypothetical protein
LAAAASCSPPWRPRMMRRGQALLAIQFCPALSWWGLHWGCPPAMALVPIVLFMHAARDAGLS